MADHRRRVFLDTGTLWLPEPEFAPLCDLGPISLYPHTTPGQLHERIRAAEIVLTNKVRMDAAALDAAPQLKLICVAATGTNNVDLDAARRHGVCVCNVVGYAAESVAQHTITLLLNLVTQMPRYLNETPRAWPNTAGFCFIEHPVGEVFGMTLGIVGVGHIGRRVATLAAALGMRVLLAERQQATPRPGRTAFSQVLEQADVLSLHCPLTDQTRHLVDATTLARMRPGALLLNTARGGLVDSQALLESLKHGHLGGAGIDTLDTEPPRADHPLLCAGLPNLLVTPHNAWGSLTARRRLILGLAENISAFAAGRPRNVVNESGAT